MDKPGFWDNQETAQEVVQELKTLRAQVDPVQGLLTRADDATVLLELADEQSDEDSRAEVQRELADLGAKTDQIELLTLLSGPNDQRPCFLSVQAGAGGADACDFAEMLLRMYLMYFEKNGFEVTEVDRRAGEEAGIQSVTLRVAGPYAYGYLSCEAGVHRLVRISPFNFRGKHRPRLSASMSCRNSRKPRSRSPRPTWRSSSTGELPGPAVRTSTRSPPRCVFAISRPISSWSASTSAARGRIGGWR